MATEQATDALLEALLDGAPVAHVIIDSSGPDDAATIAAHPDVTWALLREQPDRDAAIRLLELRVQELLLEGDPGAIRRELDSIELSRDAATDLALEAVALRASTALAWSDPEEAARVYRVYCTDADDDEMVALYTTCNRVLMVAQRWQSLIEDTPVPGPLARFVTLQWVASRVVLDQLIAELRRDMVTRSSLYLDVFDAMAGRHQRLLLYVVSLTERFLPEMPPSLENLGEEERRALGAAMGEIDRPIAGGPRLTRMLTIALTIGALIFLAGLDRAALITTLALCVVAAVYSVWLERGMYGKLVRPPLAAYLAEVGTPTGCVVSWILANRGAVKKIKAFDVAIDADAALAAIARLGRMTRLHGGPLAGN